MPFLQVYNRCSIFVCLGFYRWPSFLASSSHWYWLLWCSCCSVMVLTLAYQLSQRIYSDMSSTFRTSPETTPTNMWPHWSNINDSILADFNLALGWLIRQTTKFNSPPIFWLYSISVIVWAFQTLSILSQLFSQSKTLFFWRLDITLVIIWTICASMKRILFNWRAEK